MASTGKSIGPVEPAGSTEGIQTMLDALPAMVSYWDGELRNRMANAAYVEFFGKSPEELFGTHIRDLLGEELFARSLPYIEGALAGRKQLFDREILTPAGDVRYTQASYAPDVVEGRVRGFFVLVIDITERRRMEEEGERSRARLAEAERIARLGSWEWDIPGNRLTCSEGLYAIYGITAEDFDGHYEASNTDYIHPDDRERVEHEMEQAVETGTPVDMEYRIIRPDGRVRRLHSRAELTADAAGNALRLTGTAQDVTEMRAAAEALHQTASDLGRRAAELHSFPGHSRDADLGKVLSSRQEEILALVAEGLSNAEIASRLYLTESTVKWHVRKILRALGVANRAQAVARYLSRPRSRA
ncbi:MAG TPA: PAS domain-containing protein [Solirubrobacterales bacterium]|nr:PAS domain-containing protein [Solirubrobacterales bacterium]